MSHAGPAAAPQSRANPRSLIAHGALFLSAILILTIGITKPWRLVHEDNGAFYTSLALSHLQLGIASTRAHNVFYNPTTGERTSYQHHPPGLPLILAGWFAVVGSAEPWAARCVPILFHLGTLAVTLALLRRHFPPPRALLGGAFMITLPISAFFGRMVDFEPVCLFFIMLILLGYSRAKDGGGGVRLMSAGVMLGGFFDWGPLFFGAAIVAYETALHALKRGRRLTWPAIVWVGAAMVAIVLADVAHLWWAAGGALGGLRDVLAQNASPVAMTPARMALRLLEKYRINFTHSGLVAGALVAAGLVLPIRTGLTESLRTTHGEGFHAILRVTLVAGTAYVCAAPGWAVVHVYWQFYLLPFVVLSLLGLMSFLLDTRASGRGRWAAACAVLIAVEVVGMSGSVLVSRHRRIGDYAVVATANLERTYLSPRTTTWPPEARRARSAR